MEETASKTETLRMSRGSGSLKTAALTEDEGRRVDASAGVFAHGAHEEDGPVTWEIPYHSLGNIRLMESLVKQSPGMTEERVPWSSEKE